MKSRLLLLAIVAVGAAALYFGLTQPHVSTIPKEVRDPLADLRPVPPPPLEMPALEIPPLPVISLPPLPAPTARRDPSPPRPEVPIQNNATIDFSTGYPHVRAHGKDQDALDAALREIADVEKRTGFEAKKK
jgi:hypothetical protein